MSQVEAALLELSIVCVFNSPEVRAGCLDQSIADYTGSVNIDYVAIDNTAHQFASAGAALNYGAQLARHDLVVFVHQDVYLHSIDRLATAGRYLLGDAWGILGANGVDREGRSIGRIRDRVQLIGHNAELPQPVDSVDEVLFMIRRDRILAEPLTTDPDLAWHAYAVELGIRMREHGLGVGAINLAVSHNSLTINLDRLDVAHRRVAALHPGALPVHTTCGRIGAKSNSWRDMPILRDHKWRLRWLRGSRAAARVRRDCGLPVVLADIRLDVDLLHFAPDRVLHIINLDRSGGFASYVPRSVLLQRRAVPVHFECAPTVDDVARMIARIPDQDPFLVTGLITDELSFLHERAKQPTSWLVGLHDSDSWLLRCRALDDLPPEWSASRALPLTMPLVQRRSVNAERA